MYAILRKIKINIMKDIPSKVNLLILKNGIIVSPGSTIGSHNAVLLIKMKNKKVFITCEGEVQIGTLSKKSLILKSVEIIGYAPIEMN